MLKKIEQPTPDNLQIHNTIHYGMNSRHARKKLKKLQKDTEIKTNVNFESLYKNT